MKEFKGAKGKWYVFYGRDGLEIASNDVFFVAEIIDGDRTPEQTRANADLISAAPDLLEAIQYYFQVLEEVRGKDWDESPDHVLSKMINAVNKALGE